MQRQHPDAVFIGSIATSLLKALQFFKLFFILPLFRSEVGNYRSVEMGNDILSGLSPGYRRGSNTPSSFKRSLSFPDISWRSLAHRHKFLLCMLGLLTLLCTVYLYFAITLGSSDLCSGLGGVQRTRCQMRVNLGKAESLKTHHRRLLNVEDSGHMTEIPVSVNGQQWNVDVVTYKAMLEFELKNHKPLKAS